MMGSPFYYDVLFDEGPGDVVFHDCMWSGICTCCIQLLHQDSIYYTNESPDLKVVSSLDASLNHQSQHQSTTTQHQHNQPQSIQPLTSPNGVRQQQQQQSIHLHDSPDGVLHQHQPQPQTLQLHDSPNGVQRQQHQPQQQTQHVHLSQLNHHPQPQHMQQQQQHHLHHHHHHHHDSLAPSSDAASSISNSTSPKPVRRREHNDSERKRRDHLRNAFNFLRDQVPRFKSISKKPPRIQILHEATQYVNRIAKESAELERRLEEERAKHERLKNL